MAGKTPGKRLAADRGAAIAERTQIIDKHTPYRIARRIVIAVVGTSITLFGVLLLVLPGPAFVVIPTGLAVLSLEFAWARRWLRRLRDEAAKQADGLKGFNGKKRDS